MWTLIKFLVFAPIAIRCGLLVLALLAVMAGFLALGVGNMISHADQHRLMQHNIEDSHRLNNWRLK